MATEKQISANRLNAQFSTGPRTEAGKARASRNALRDGFYSKALIVLPGLEDEFQLLRTQLLDSYQPEGGVQDSLFDEILIASWNLRRAAISEARIYASQSDLSADPLEDDTNEVKLRRIRQFARHNQTARDKAIQQLSTIQTEIRSRLQAFPPQEDADIPAMLQKPHSLSLLCRVDDVVASMKKAQGFKSAPLPRPETVKNEADSALPSALEIGAMLQAKNAGAAISRSAEVNL